jgi:prolyl-tRNA editing enzyme YbaK/EbsC (Cys-tRNA(Pro) deacylase)
MRDKVKQAARELGLDVDVQTLDRPTRTVSEAADAVDCEAAQIAKTLVFIADGDPILAVVSGAHRLDEDLLCDAIDCAEARQATPDEVRSATGFAVGGVSPIGTDLPVVFDQALLEHDRIYAAGGDGNTLFGVSPQKLVDCLGAKVAPLAATGS